MNPLRLKSAIVALAILAGTAQADSGFYEVDMQLVLAVDISFSISLDEQDIQRRGYVAAFRDADVIRAVTSGYRGRIAVTLMEWAGDDMQVQVVPWTLIADRASAEAFAARLAAAQVNRSGRTSISAALAAAIGLFPQSPFRASRQVVDISSDGLNNSGQRVDRVRDRLVYHGITINGLPLMIGGDDAALPLDAYFRDCVIGGAGAFMTPVLSWNAFGPTLKQKLIAEISGPAPAPPRVMQAAATDCLIGEKIERQKYIDQLKGATGTRAPRWIPREEDWPLPE